MNAVTSLIRETARTATGRANCRAVIAAVTVSTTTPWRAGGFAVTRRSTRDGPVVARSGTCAVCTSGRVPMIEQLTLGAVRHSDPDTSRAAAARQRFSGIPAAILECFDHLQIGGYTDDDLAGLLSWANGPTVKSARSRLKNAGLLVDSGVRRPSANGSEMIVWVRVR